MDSCAAHRDELAELAALAVADGAPGDDGYAAVRQHLAQCSCCREELVRLRRVEAALRAWPLTPPPRDLVEPVMARVEREPQQPAWHWLPWTLWLPALAIALALGLALSANVAGHASPSSALSTPSPLQLTPAPPASDLRQPLGTNGSELFWAIWCGLFVTLAGMGICLGLTSSKQDLPDISADLKERWEHLREAAHL